MKANELMIGDWVFTRGQIEQVTSIYDGYICTEHYEDSHDYYFEPIPITPEILEKNGFSEQRAERMSVWLLLGFSIELDFSTWKYYWANGDVEISSIHELQHALRLCGIEKEIVL